VKLLDLFQACDASASASDTNIVNLARSKSSAYSAEFGRNTGAQISMITRSGTNEFSRGGLGLLSRKPDGNGQSAQHKRAGINQTPRYVANQAGGDFGGPLIKVRTFFFGLLETNRRCEAADVRNADPANIPNTGTICSIGDGTRKQTTI
jgi:hypothetical protein